MKRFQVSKHMYYLFKRNDNEGIQNNYEDIFVPKIFINLYNLSKKPKKKSIKKKNDQPKYYLLNSNSYFSNQQLDKFKIYDYNNLFVPNKIFGNNKRYSSTKKTFQTCFPAVKKSINKNKKFNQIKNKIAQLKSLNNSKDKILKHNTNIPQNKKLNFSNI